ncbi:COPI alpha [Acrasis kona]|uniref:Coatomer subunit alpha n=1 Tax=Acrasis kona TaxID=1008807 RepID=A0AAW2ZE61_9EUKA
MLIKFETKSNRVKGLSFHPKRPWILASLHTGIIQLWDYRMGTLLDTYDEHEAPVRGIDFHSTQPLFVSGGDDYKIKVWNYKLRRCLFTLQGHSDYIRSVEFHSQQPWIVSASDDQNIRIWNWQSRQCIAVLPGHNHYVMSASFHPRDDLIVSASLDQTVRVWDISGLKKKSTQATPSAFSGPAGAAEELLKMSQLNQDLFGTGDAMVKYILEGHDRGVNWAAFHPTMQLIISAADDKQVKMWKINDVKAWEVDTLSGHVGNVSCALFHPKKDLIVSNSEDRTIRFYDVTKNTFVKSYRREQDRFWTLDVHPSQNLIAAGHDTGLIVFKLERERPSYDTFKNEVFFVKDKFLKRFDYKAQKEQTVAILRRSTPRPARSLVYNYHENYVLVTSDQDGGSYELFKVPKVSGTSSSSSSDVDICTQLKKGKAVAAIFTGLKKYAVLERSRKVYIKNITSDQTKEISLPTNIGAVEGIFPATSGRMLLRSEDKVHLYDFEQQTVIASITAANVKYVVWNGDNSRVALLSKHVIIVANSKLEPLCNVHETIRIKSGSFDENNVLLYTTLNHMKYCLESGDSGTIKTLDLPLYLVKVEGSKVHFIDREGNVGATEIDTIEYRFKSALVNGKISQIRNIIGQSQILGDSIIAYMQQKGYPQVAMKFVRDDNTKFGLALECGNIEAALQAAHKLDNKDCWARLGQEALRQGNLNIVEKCYQRTKDFERLSFLYLTTGGTNNLKKMLKIAKHREDVQSRFHNALFLGDVEHRIDVLREVGQYNLAYVTAITHGLDRIAQEIQPYLDANFQMPSLDFAPQLLVPPTPLCTETNWPLLNTSESVQFDAKGISGDDAEQVNKEDLSQWDDDGGIDSIGVSANGFMDGLDDLQDKQQQVSTPSELGTNSWETLEPFETGGIMDSDAAFPSDYDSTNSALLEPTPGRVFSEVWLENSQVPSDHISANSFATAMNILNKSTGIVNFAPLKPIFINMYMASRGSLSLTPSLPSLSLPMQKVTTLQQRDDDNDDADDERVAYCPIVSAPKISELNDKLKNGLKSVTSGRFEEALSTVREVLQAIVFAPLPNKKSDQDAKENIKVCVEYITALRLEIHRRKIHASEPVRSAELAAYFTKCKLNPTHTLLGLNNAMTINFKLENYLVAVAFATRLINLPNGTEKMVKDAKYVLSQKETRNTNKHELNYDERNPFVICNHSMTPIYSGSPKELCSYCQASYLPKYKDTLCVVCDLGKIGQSAPGLYSYLQQFKFAKHSE